MKRRPLALRALARRDVDGAVDFYRREAGERVALGFVEAFESACRSIALHPAAASLRYAYELGVPGLRTKALRKYPYLIFYVERPDVVDVWRVLHTHRDIPASIAHLGDL